MESIIICLMGAQGSGKSTIEKWVHNELGIPRLISHTTRPRREGEQEDEYHFVTTEQFDQLDSIDGGFAEVREYQVAGGDLWKYGLHSGSIYAPVHVVVVDYKGFIELREQYKVIGIHFDISKSESYRRVLSNRPDYPYEECERRFASDLVDIQEPARSDGLVIQINSEQNIQETKREIRSYVKLAQTGMSEQDLYDMWYEERVWEVTGMIKMIEKENEDETI